MSTPKITAFINPYCPWTPGVIQVLKEYGLPFEARDVMRDADAYREMATKSGQSSTPTVEINGHILPDVGGDEVEAWLKANGYAKAEAAG